MAGPNDKIQIEAEIEPTLGRTEALERQLAKRLTDATKPLMDTLSNTKIGLDQKSMDKARRQIAELGMQVGPSFQRAMQTVFDEKNIDKLTARGLKGLTRDKTVGADVTRLVQVLGGYSDAADYLSRPDARRRMEGLSRAFNSMNDVANQMANIPGISDETNRLLSRLYRSNTAESFSKLSAAQQKMVQDAVAILGLQDRSLTSLRNAMATAGVGRTATDLSRQLTERKQVASRLARVTSSEQLLREQRRNESRMLSQQKLEESRARGQARSLQARNVLQRTGGVSGLRDPQDIRAVRAGLNQDYNHAINQQALAALEKGKTRSPQYREATKLVESLQVQRRQLDEHTDGLKRQAKEQAAHHKGMIASQEHQQRLRANHLRARDKIEQSRDTELWRARTKAQEAQHKGMMASQEHQQRLRANFLRQQSKIEQNRQVELWKAETKANNDARQLNQRRDTQLYEWKRRQEQLAVSKAKSEAVSQEARRILRRTGGLQGLQDPQEIRAVRAGLNRDLSYAIQQRAVHGINPNVAASTLQQSERTIDNLRAQLRELDDIARLQRQADTQRRKALRADQAVQKTEGQLRTQRARNAQQAMQIMRQTGGDLSLLDSGQVRTVRPYLQDRFQARSRFAESQAAQFGSNSPQFIRAAESAQRYAVALGDLDQRARSLRPQLSDLGQVIRTFTRYALGYGALYQLLGGVTALGRGLVDLDEQFYSIQAITMSTDAQMQVIESSIKAVGLTTKFTLNEIAQGAQILSQAGTAAENIPELLKATADFAAATNTQIASSADLITSFQNVYSDISGGKTADMLTKALNLSKLQGEDLRTIVSYTAQTAQGYNISAESLLGAVATLRNVGIKPSTVATGLRQAMLEIFSPDARLLKTLEARYAQMGENLSQSAIAAQFQAYTFADNPLVAAIAELRRIGFADEAAPMFTRAIDVRSYTPLKALVANFDQFSGLSSQVAVGQSATEASQIQMESLRATLQNLGAAVVAFSDSIGGGMVRSLQSGAEAMTELLQKFTEMDQLMKLETGEGLGQRVGLGLLGGVAGAAIGGRGVLSRTGGFVAGATAAGGMDSAIRGSDSGVMDYALPAMAGLLAVAGPLMDFISGFKGQQGKIGQLTKASQKIAGADIGSTIGPALTMGAALGDVADSLKGGGKGWWGKMSGLGGRGIARVVAGMGLRLVPVLGILYTAYELISWLSGSGDEVQQAADRARTQAQAAGDLYRTALGQRNEQQGRVEEYDIDSMGNTKASSTASAVMALVRQTEGVTISVRDLLGTEVGQLGEARAILEDYASQSELQRGEQLKKLEKITGHLLTDAEAYDLSTQLTQLRTGVAGFRDDLVVMINRSTDEMMEAISRGDTEGTENAARIQRAIDSVDGLRDYLYGHIEVDATQVAEMYRQFSLAMARESEKGVMNASDLLSKLVEKTSKDILAVGAQLGNSSQVRDRIQAIIASVIATEQNTVSALEAIQGALADGEKELEAKVRQLETRAAQARAQASRLASIDQAYGYNRAGPAQREADTATALAEQARGELNTSRTGQQLAADEAERQRQRDALALQRAQSEVADVMSDFTRVLDSGGFDAEFLKTVSSPNQRQLLAQMSDPTTRAQLMDADVAEPQQVRTGEYRLSAEMQGIQSLLLAQAQFLTTREQTTKQQQREDALRDMRSDPAVLVEIARLENARKAADRRNQHGVSQGLTQQIHALQYGEQEKAVARARYKMEEAEADPKKDGTAAAERYYSELAKLESMRGDMADKLDEYQKKIVDLDLKQRTVELQTNQRSLQRQFGEATTRGDFDTALRVSKEYEQVQAGLLKLAQEELAAKGYSPEQIALEVSAREDLTVALIDQEAAQRKLTTAMLENINFRTRRAGTGPTTGDQMVDAYVRTSGVGFTNDQRRVAGQRDIDLYTQRINEAEAAWRKQSATMVSGSDEERNALQAYVTTIEAARIAIGETRAEMKQLENNFIDELGEGLNPTRLLVALQASENHLSRFSDMLHGTVLTGIDGIGQALADAATGAQDLDDALRNVIYTMANEVFTGGMKMGVNWLFEQGLGMMPGVADGSSEAQGVSGMLGGLLGLGGEAMGTANIQAGVVNLTGPIAGAEGLPGMGGLSDLFGGGAEAPIDPTGEVADKIGGAVGEKVAGPFAGLGQTITSGFSGLLGGMGSIFSGLLGGIGGAVSGGARWLGMAVQAGMAYFTGGASVAAGAAAGASAGGYASGGMPSRKILGKRSSKRDNLMATAMVGGKAHPIQVEADEGILSRKAMAAIGGEAGLNMLNSGAVPRFSVGGKPSASYNQGQRAQTGADAMAAGVARAAGGMAGNATSTGAKEEINIANVYSEQGFADYVSSRHGRKVIINMLQKEGVVK